MAFTIVLSCESPEAETNYKPATANYDYPAGITLGSGIVTNSSFQFTANIAGTGEAYYVAVEGGSDAPSNNDVFDGDASGLIASGSFDVTGNPATITVNDGLCDNTTYDIYVVQFTSDSFLSETTTMHSITTNDNGSIGGTYDTVTNGDLSGNFGGSVADYESVVTITDNGDGTYTFSDATAGIYADPNYYGGFGHPALPHTFEVPCNEISAEFTTLFWNCCGDFISFEGFINADGTISVHWESAFGEVMDVVYTKQ